MSKNSGTVSDVCHASPRVTVWSYTAGVTCYKADQTTKTVVDHTERPFRAPIMACRVTVTLERTDCLGHASSNVKP